jgi:hypothetical protein
LFLLLAAQAGAQDGPRVGVFFDQDEYTDANRYYNFTPNVPFDMYIVALDADEIASLAAYELGLTLPAEMFTVDVSGPNGWTNFGGNTNHLVGFGAGGAGYPIPGPDGAVVLCTVQVLMTGGDGWIEIGPADPPSDPDWDGPVLVAAGDLNDLIRAEVVTGGPNGPVAYVTSQSTEAESISVTVDGEDSVIAAAAIGATDGYDPDHDVRAEPDARIRFPRPQWDAPYEDFEKDVRAPYDVTSEVKNWTFEVTTDVPDPQDPQLVTLTVDTVDESDTDAALYLYDHDAGITIPVTPGGQYQYVAYDSETRVLDLFVGDLDYPDPLQVSVAGYLGDLADTGNIARTETGATDGWDGSLDIPEPAPPPGDYLHVSFHHPDWPVGPYYRTDTRASYDVFNESRTWPLRVQTDQAGTVTLDFGPNFTPNSGVGLVLVDAETGATENLLPDLVHTFETSGGTHDFELRVGAPVVPDLDPASRTLGPGWSLVGLPLAPPAGATLGGVVLDGAPGFAYAYGQADDGQYEYLEPDTTASRERGYWVGTDQAYTWSMPGSLNYNTVVLPARNGWNLLGNPMWFPASVAGVQVRHAGTMYAWEDAVDAGLVSSVVYGYNTAAGDYQEVTSLQAWQGYWMRALTEGVELVLDWVNLQTAPPLPQVLGQPDLPAPLDWTVDLQVRAPDGTRRAVTCGVAPEATAGFDARQDKPTPPPAPTAQPLRLSILREDLAPDLDQRFRQELTDPDQPGFAWTLELEAGEPGPYTVSWRRRDWPADLDLQLVDPTDGRVIAASLRGMDQVTLPVETEPVRLQLRSPGEATETPDADALVDRLTAAPNPFNPVTTLRLELARAGEVRVSIFDVRGKRVDELALGHLAAGRHDVTWQARGAGGRDLASGVYFAVLERDGQRRGQIARLSLIR